MADSNRTLTINIAVNSGKAVQSLNALKTALGQMVQAGTASGLAASAKAAEEAMQRAATASRAAATATKGSAEANVAAATSARLLAPAYQMYSDATRKATANVKAHAEAVTTMARSTTATGRLLAPTYQMWATETRAATAAVTTMAQTMAPADSAAQRLANTTGRLLAPAYRMWSTETRAATATFSENTAAMVNMSARGTGLMGTLQGLRDRFQGMEADMDRNRRMAYAMTIAGIQLKMAAEAISAAIGNATDKFAEFDFNMRRAAGAAGIWSDQSQMYDKLGDSVIKLARETKLFTPAEIAKGMYYWSSATGDVIDSQEKLVLTSNQVVTVMKAAAMTEGDLETTLKGVLAVTAQFSLGMEKASDVTMKLVSTAQKTQTELPDLLNSLKMMGPVADSFGVSLDDVLKTLSALGDVGIKGTMAGRALAMMFAKLADPTLKATKLLDEYAARAGKLKPFHELIFPEGKFIGLQGYFRLLGEMVQNLDMAEREALLAAITTQNEWRALDPLVRKNIESLFLYKKGILDVQDSLDGYQEAFEQQWGLIADSLKANLGEIANAFEPILLMIGNAVSSMVEEIKPIALAIADAVAEFMKANPEVVKLLVGVTAIGAAIMGAVASMMLFVGAWRLIFKVAGVELMLDGLNALIGRMGAAKVAAVGLQTEMFATQKALWAGGPKGGKDILNWLIAPYAKIAEILGDKVKAGFSKLGELAATTFATVSNSRIGIAFKAGLNGLASIFSSAGSYLGGIWGGAFAAAAVTFGIALVGAAVWNIGQSQLSENAAMVMGEAEKLKATIGAMTDEELGKLKIAADKARSEGYGRLGNDEQKAAALEYLAVIETEVNNRAIRMHAALERAFYIEEHAGDASATAATNNMASAVTAASPVVQSAIDMMFSNTVRAQRAGQQTLKTWVAGMRNAFPEVAPTVTALYDAAVGMMESNSPKVRAAGNATMIALAEAINSGKQSKIIPAFKNVLATANNLISNNNPKMKQAGYRMLIELAQGFRNNKNLDTATKTQLYLAIKQLGSGNAAFQTAGANIVLSVANGMISQQDVLTGAARAMRDRVAAQFGPEMAKRIFGTGSSGTPLKAVDLLGFSSKDAEAPSGGGGGGGGSAEKKQSPLEKALEVAKGAADLAEALQKVAGLDVKAMVQKSMKPLAEAMLLADKITYQITKSFGAKKLKEVAEFSDASQKVASMIGTAVDAFAKMVDFKKPPESTLRAVANSVSTIVDMVAKASKKLKADGVAAAVVFSDSAGKVMTMVGGALDAFAKIGEELPSLPGDEFWNALVALVASLTVKVGEAAKTIKGDLSKAAKEFSDNAGSVMTLIGGALDAFSKTQEYIAPTEGLIESLVNSVKMSVQAILDLSTEMKIDPKVMTALGAFAKSVSEIVGAIRATAEAFKPLKQEIIDPEKEQWVPVTITEQIAQMKATLDAVQSLADGIDLGTIKSMERLANIAEKIGGAIRSFFEMSQPQKQSSEEGAAPVEFANLGQVVAGVLSGIMSSMTTFVGKMDNVGASLVSNIIQGMQSQEAALSMEVARINSILGAVGGTASFSWTVAARPNPVAVNVSVTSPDGSVGNMSLAQIEQAINSGLGNIQSAFGTA